MANPLRKTMVYLGLADEEFDYDAGVPSAPAAPAAAQPREQHREPANRAPVTPLRRAAAPRQGGAPEMNEILTVHPRAYKDAQVIAENFREGIPVIMNLSEMADEDAKRLVDFAAGLIFAVRGSIERVTSKVFLLSPPNVAVAAEDKARIAEGGFFNQS